MLAVSDGGSQKGAAVPPHHPALVQDQNFPPSTPLPTCPSTVVSPFPGSHPHPVPWRTWMVSTPLPLSPCPLLAHLDGQHSRCTRVEKARCLCVPHLRGWTGAQQRVSQLQGVGYSVCTSHVTSFVPTKV